MVSLPYQQRSQRFPHRGDKISLQMDKLPLLGKTVLITGSARRVGRRAWILASDLGKPAEASKLISRANKLSPLYALVNSAAIFDWDRHLTNNLTAPFLLGQAFAKQLPEGTEGRIVNILDWRALRPGGPLPLHDQQSRASCIHPVPGSRARAAHFRQRAGAGAVLPPVDRGASPEIIKNVPLGRGSDEEEVQQALVFLLAGPAYVTGEIVHVDGGRHLI